MNHPTPIASVQATFDAPAFNFVRPQITAGWDVLYAFVVTSTPSNVISPGWTEVARFQADQRLTVLRRVVDGSEPSIMSIVVDNVALGSNACMVFAFQNSTGAHHQIDGVNLTDPTDTYSCPALTKSNGLDSYIGIVATNGSSVDAVAPAGAIVHANVRDAGFASIQLLIFEAVIGGTSVPAQVATLASAQPGMAVALVIPA